MCQLRIHCVRTVRNLRSSAMFSYRTFASTYVLWALIYSAGAAEFKGTLEIVDDPVCPKLVNACYDLKVKLFVDGKELTVPPLGNFYAQIIDNFGQIQKFRTTNSTYIFGWMLPPTPGTLTLTVNETKLGPRPDYYVFKGVRSFDVIDRHISNGALLLKQHNCYLQNVVAANVHFTLTLSSKDQAFGCKRYVTIFWYLDCMYLGRSTDTGIHYAFTDIDQTHEIVGAVVVTHQGQVPHLSPYTCSNNSLQEVQHKAIGYSSNLHEIPVCPPNNQSSVSMGVFRRTFVTRNVTELRNGGLVLTQKGATVTSVITTADTLHMRIELPKDDNAYVQKAGTFKTFWFSNCKPLGKTSNMSYHHKFAQPNMTYQLVAVIVATFDNGPINSTYYNCSTHRFVQQKPPVIVGAFRTTVVTRHIAKLSNGKLQILQKGILRGEFVATDVSSTVSIELSGKTRTVLRRTKHFKTFWFSNCVLVNHSIDSMSTELKFNNSQPHTVLGVLVVTFAGPPPDDPPYFCENNTINENITYAVGVFRRAYVARDLLLSDGELMLRQKGTLRQMLAATTDKFNLTIELHGKDRKATSKAKLLKTFWYSNCDLMGTAAGRSFQSSFKAANKLYQIVAVLVVIHKGPALEESPYNCLNDTLHDNTDTNRALGIFRKNFFTRDPIRIVSVKGDKGVSVTQTVNLKITFNGSRPWTYCVLVFNVGYKGNGHEKCPPNVTNYESHHIEYSNKFAESKVLLFIISNDVSKQIKHVPINVLPGRQRKRKTHR